MIKAFNKYLVLFLYVCSWVIIILSKFTKSYENLLIQSTKENSFFEWISVIILFLIFIYGLYWVIKYHTNKNKFFLICIIIFSIISLLGALEEISWGQNLFHFQSNHYFVEHNFQKETNLHNLIPANLFSSIIYSSVYTFFVFIPLLGRLFFKKTIIKYFPSLHVTLLVLFASSFQVYFYDDFGAWFDTGTLLVGIILFFIIVTQKKIWTKSLIVHFIFIVLSTCLFAYSYEIFDFYNRQYEIREAFVALAIFIYFTQILSKLNAPNL